MYRRQTTYQRVPGSIWIPGLQEVQASVQRPGPFRKYVWQIHGRIGRRIFLIMEGSSWLKAGAWQDISTIIWTTDCSPLSRE